MKSKMIIALSLMVFTQISFGREVAGVNVPETAEVHGEKLVLNGAGIRSKFFFSIYIGALYLPERIKKPDQVFSNQKSKRVLMHVLYKKLEAKKITDGWQEGFKKNNSNAEFEQLSARLKTFNSFFSDSKTGDEIVMDYIPDTGTRVSINNTVRGTIPGADFNTALLKVWLGERPADSNLKESMLGLD